MASESDDPFGLKDRDATTVVPRGPRRFERGGETVVLSVTSGRRQPAGPLLAKAERLLTLATVLRTTSMPANPLGVAADLRASLETYAASIAGDADARTVQHARLILAAFVDDVIINGTPWGLSTLGPGQRFAGTLYGDIDAGRTFFKILDEAERTPDRAFDLLQLMYACLALGFEGVYRTAPPPGRTLDQRTTDLYELLRHRHGPDDAIAPHWRGLDVPMLPEQRRVPLLVAPVTGMVILACTYMALDQRLGTLSEAVARLLPPQPPRVFGHVATRPPTPLPPPPIPPRQPVVELAAFLQSEQKHGLVAVLDEGIHATVRLLGSDVFASGSDVLQPGYERVIGRIAQALDDRPGAITVVGHTDNVPVGGGRFASNQELSEARAASVARLLAQRLREPREIKVEGAGATRPIADNATREGRARNRRVEIQVARATGEPAK